MIKKAYGWAYLLSLFLGWIGCNVLFFVCLVKLFGVESLDSKLWLVAAMAAFDMKADQLCVKIDLKMTEVVGPEPIRYIAQSRS